VGKMFCDRNFIFYRYLNLKAEIRGCSEEKKVQFEKSHFMNPKSCDFSFYQNLGLGIEFGLDYYF